MPSVLQLEVIRAGAEANEPREETAVRDALTARGFSVFRWQDPPGTEYPPHSHAEDEIIWLLEGAISFGVGDSDLALAPGDRLLLPADTVHTARAGAAGAAYLIGERRR